MLNFRDLSLRRKQTLIIMLTSIVVLLLACAAFSIYEVITFRKGMVQHLSTLAEIVGNNTSAALEFDVSQPAVETLSALQAEPGIIGACIYRKSGEAFATYDRAHDDITFTPPALIKEGHTFARQRLILSRPIVQKGETIGVVYLESDMRALSSRLSRYAGIVGLVFLASLVLAFMLSSQLQRLVSDPILRLAQVARAVALEKNYSVRATKQSNDELGQLVDGFNEMLAQIQSRDIALQTARDNLEKRVEDRTQSLQLEIRERKDAEAALRDSDEKFRQLAENITDVFWIRSPDMYKVYYVSPAYEQTWGRSTESLYANPQQWADDILREDRERVHAAFAALTGAAPSLSIEYRIVRADGEVRWVHARGFQVRDATDELIRLTGIITDITERKLANEKLEKAHKQLLETSRRAGMAEVASSVLHNVGNVLNSVNVASSCLADSLRRSNAANLSKVVTMLSEHEGDLGTFLTSDPKGKQLPGYLEQLAEHLAGEQAAALKELAGLQKNIDHIKDIVAMQQSYGQVSGVTETMKITDLVEDALRMNAGALTRHDVQVICEYGEVPPVTIDKHKVLQVLVNLIRNAKYACDESGRADKRLTVQVANGDGRVKISVVDNGIGIPRENLTRIFNHGFTTRKDGHGFGLHSGALAAKELGGSLTVHSDGLGQGAAFTLELPCPTRENSHE